MKRKMISISMIMTWPHTPYYVSVKSKNDHHPPPPPAYPGNLMRGRLHMVGNLMWNAAHLVRHLTMIKEMLNKMATSFRIAWKRLIIIKATRLRKRQHQNNINVTWCLSSSVQKKKTHIKHEFVVIKFFLKFVINRDLLQCILMIAVYW